MKATAVKVFVADSPTNLEHDINEWMTDPDEHFVKLSYDEHEIRGKLYLR